MPGIDTAAKYAGKAFGVLKEAGGFLKNAGRAVKADPLMALGAPKAFRAAKPGLAAAAAIGTGEFAWDMSKPFRDTIQDVVQDRPRHRFETQVDIQRRMMNQRAAMSLRRQRLERDYAQNAARLAAVAPDIYNSILAGRELPRGAVVLGGQPRTDLLEDLAARMADGSFQEQDPLAGL